MGSSTNDVLLLFNTRLKYLWRTRAAMEDRKVTHWGGGGRFVAIDAVVVEPGCRAESQPAQLYRSRVGLSYRWHGYRAFEMGSKVLAACEDLSARGTLRFVEHHCMGVLRYGIPSFWRYHEGLGKSHIQYFHRSLECRLHSEVQRCIPPLEGDD